MAYKSPGRDLDVSKRMKLGTSFSRIPGVEGKKAFKYIYIYTFFESVIWLDNKYKYSAATVVRLEKTSLRNVLEQGSMIENLISKGKR